ncbi:MAG: hydrogenase iron-sulfur subunit [Candidatus Atabeyarchaeum deiterrae]
MSHSNEKNDEFEPYILGLVCNWCTYAGADMAGTSRIQYPPNLRLVRVMCTSRLAPEYVMKGLELGADGVLVSGCHPGDCHYVNGNYKTERRIHLLRKLVEQAGLEPQRIRLEWISASEGSKLAEVIKDYVKVLKKIGPNPLKDSKGKQGLDEKELYSVEVK